MLNQRSFLHYCNKNDRKQNIFDSVSCDYLTICAVNMQAALKTLSVIKVIRNVCQVGQALH